MAPPHEDATAELRAILLNLLVFHSEAAAAVRMTLDLLTGEARPPSRARLDEDGFKKLLDGWQKKEN